MERAHLKEVQEICAKESLFTKQYDQVNLIHFSPYSSLIPKEYAEDPTLWKALVQFDYKALEKENLMQDTVIGIDAKNLFLPFKTGAVLLENQAISYTHRHAGSLFIEKILRLAPNENTFQVFLYIEKNQLVVLALKNKEVLLYNHFTFINEQDFIYYVLFCLEQLKLNPDSVPLYVLGDCDKDSSLFQMGYTYVRNIKLFKEALDGENNTYIDTNYLLLP